MDQPPPADVLHKADYLDGLALDRSTAQPAAKAARGEARGIRAGWAAAVQHAAAQLRQGVCCNVFMEVQQNEGRVVGDPALFHYACFWLEHAAQVVERQTHAFLLSQQQL